MGGAGWRHGGSGGERDEVGEAKWTATGGGGGGVSRADKVVVEVATGALYESGGLTSEACAQSGQGFGVSQGSVRNR